MKNPIKAPAKRPIMSVMMLAAAVDMALSWQE
jgi:hypothetical protein